MQHLALRESSNALRAPDTHWALAVAIIWSLRRILWINLYCFIFFMMERFQGRSPPSLLAMFGAMNGAALLLWIVLVGKKNRARNSCNILFLRGFRQEARADVPNRVLPCIGCYGRLMWLPNVVKVVHQDQIGPLSGEAMTDSRAQPVVREDWKFELRKLLNEADLAIIDFSVASDSLFWEIEQCLKQMPAQRMVLITELSRHATTDYLALCESFPELRNTPSPIPVYPSRFVIPLRFWKWWFFQYEWRMHKCMKSIADQSPAFKRIG